MSKKIGGACKRRSFTQAKIPNMPLLKVFLSSQPRLRGHTKKLQENLGMVKGGTQLIECSLDQLYYGIFRELLRGAQNKKASPKTNKNPAEEASEGKARSRLFSFATPFILAWPHYREQVRLAERQILKGGATTFHSGKRARGGGRVAGRG